MQCFFNVKHKDVSNSTKYDSGYDMPIGGMRQIVIGNKKDSQRLSDKPILVRDSSLRGQVDINQNASDAKDKSYAKFHIIFAIVKYND